MVLGFEDKPKSSGYACFRAFFKGNLLDQDPIYKEFLEKECVNIWIGHDVHLIQNTLRDGEEFNWILNRKDPSELDPDESWFHQGDMNEVREIMKTCDPRIAAAVNQTKECLDWKICYRDPIPSWVSKNNTIALIGDACHPHLPTSAQGASQATESGAVLAMCLKLAGKGQVPLAVSLSCLVSGYWHTQADGAYCRRGCTRNCGLTEFVARSSTAKICVTGGTMHSERWKPEASSIPNPSNSGYVLLSVCR